jgi:NAD(P)-dependent dehydrogenase (short-subunit alcohol dehydrogenase family)
MKVERSRGSVETPIFGKLGLPPKAVDELAQDIASRVPLGRIGSADEIAAAALFLASASASFMTGSEISVDGGFAQV